MDFKSATGLSIKQAFEKFDAENPLIYTLFKKHTFQAIDAGKKKCSSKLILNVIRWKYYIETKTDDVYRINDAFTAHYARKFICEHPRYKDLFELRQLRSREETRVDGNGQIAMSI